MAGSHLSFLGNISVRFIVGVFDGWVGTISYEDTDDVRKFASTGVMERSVSRVTLSIDL